MLWYDRSSTLFTDVRIESSFSTSLTERLLSVAMELLWKHCDTKEVPLQPCVWAIPLSKEISHFDHAVIAHSVHHFILK